MHKNTEMELFDQYREIIKFWNPKEHPLPEKPKKYKKITVVTTCMNRTDDLRKTLINNIETTNSYPNREFILLNYGSTDDLEEYTKRELDKYIQAGVLVYCHTTQPKKYDMSHSRNLGFRLASGDIVNNVDADNIIGPEFFDVVNKLSELFPEKASFLKGRQRLRGRVGMYKKEFMELGGYDESLPPYGYDDHDLAFRSLLNGNVMAYWGPFVKSDRFSTPNHVRKSNYGRDIEEMKIEAREMTIKKLAEKKYIANAGTPFGCGEVTRNFCERVSLQ